VAYVVRVPPAELTIDRLWEQNVLGQVRDAFGELGGQQTPRCSLSELIAFDSNSGCMISRFCGWPLLADTGGVSGTQLGCFLAALHKTLAPLAPQLGQRGDKHTGMAATVTADLAAACVPQTVLESWGSSMSLANEYADRRGTQAQACHLDLNPWNLLLEPRPGSDWLTLDWETLGLDDPLFDLASLVDGYALAQQLDRAAHRQLSSEALNTYAIKCGWGSIPEDVAEAVGKAFEAARTLFSWREYSWAIARICEGNKRVEIAAQREHFAKVLAQQGLQVV
jgi:Ser/Thr protein kinase RdoA (MazF antagonist)